MSYCRWSSDDGKSDLYVYANVSGDWTIHVAANRLTAPMSKCPKMEIEGGGSVGAPTRESWDRQDAWFAANRQDIDLPFAGETFQTPTPAACLKKCVELAALGYHVPAHALERLRGEADADR